MKLLQALYMLSNLFISLFVLP